MSEERVTTGSEPRRTWTLYEHPQFGWRVNEVFGNLDLAEGARKNGWPVVAVVESGHDEQSEGWRCPKCGDPHQAYCYRCGTRPDDWQPDPRTVAAVVEALREADHAPGGNPGFMHMSRAADFIEERFKPSAPGGGTGPVA